MEPTYLVNNAQLGEFRNILTMPSFRFLIWRMKPTNSVIIPDPSLLRTEFPCMTFLRKSYIVTLELEHIFICYHFRDLSSSWRLILVLLKYAAMHWLLVGHAEAKLGCPKRITEQSCVCVNILFIINQYIYVCYSHQLNCI